MLNEQQANGERRLFDTERGKLGPAMGAIILQQTQLWLAAGGFLIGVVFGYTASRTNFCTMGAISDLYAFGDTRRLRAWVLAAAIALIGVQLLDAWGVVALSRSLYLAPDLSWLGSIAGGLLFGFGMVLAGGCASRNLVRTGAGDLRALLTLMVLGLVAYMSMGGLIGPLRDWLERSTQVPLTRLGFETQGLGEIAARLAGSASPAAGRIPVALVAALLLAYCFKERTFRISPIHILSGLAVGACVIAGWALTGLTYDDLALHPSAPISLTFVRPTADALDWLARFTAVPIPGFGVTTVFGTIFGSFLAARQTGRFKWSTFGDVGETKRSLAGAALMGLGGVLAHGCTVGQGITGISTLALGSFLTFAAIVAGGLASLKRLEAGLES